MNSVQRQRKTKDPCPRCRLHRSRCICHLIPRLSLTTRLVLIVHAKELKRTTNTGRLAVEALENAKIYVRGEGREALDLSSALDPAFESVLLYPSEDAVDLESYQATRPMQLFVPDGNWRQASKVGQRQKELRDLPRVRLSSPQMHAHKLRKEHFQDGMATLEAIALALGVLEGDEVGFKLMALYHAKLAATLEGRGQS